MVATSFFNLDSIVIFAQMSFQKAFEVAHEKFAAHIPSHPGRSLFHACQIFDLKFICSSDITQRDIRQYNIIQELNDPSNVLLDE